MVKKKKTRIAVYITTALLTTWSFGSWYIVKDLEEPSYKVISKTDDYEVRLYDPYIIAKTTVSGDYQKAMNDGFREVATYIFGGNNADNEIEMTVPVLENTPQEIAMTVPVLDTGNTNKRTVAFVMPSKFTLESLPVPNSDKVTFAEVAQRKVAVLRYGFYANEARIDAKKRELLESLRRSDISVKGEVTSARYNPPFSMPLLLRNEVFVEIN